MKTLYFIFTVAFISLAGILQAQTKEEKAKIQEEAFQKTLSLVESHHFQVKIDRVHPTTGQDVSRFNPEGSFNIKDSIAAGQLPFFGRAYNLPYGDGGGIKFNSKMIDQSMKTIDKKKKGKIIFYRFSVPGEGIDMFRISMEIGASGACTVNVNSNNRASISYSGKIIPIEAVEK